ncbi:MAG: SCE4755 family polysaccharide monooxygenase-like protein, partial [Myxococcota bacterium]
MSTSATVKGSLLFVVPVAFLIAETTVAFAHIQLDEPTRRQTDVVGPSLQQKRGPCGTNARSSNVSVFEPGATITVRWSETIEHPGHFRIAFDADGQDDFRDPICLTNCENLSNPTFEFNSDETILVDNITDATNGTYSVPVTLPNIECSNCTLQLIQVMYDKPPYTTDARSNDMYYQCADLILRSAVPADAGTPTPDAAPVPDTGPPVVPDAGKRDVGLPRDGGRGPLDAGTIDGPPPLRSDEGLTG